jgi:hypothetical protein
MTKTLYFAELIYLTEFFVVRVGYLYLEVKELPHPSAPHKCDHPPSPRWRRNIRKKV